MESECRQRATARQLSLITQIPMLSRYFRQHEQSLTVIVGVASTMREAGVANSEWRVANREEKRPAIRYSLLATRYSLLATRYSLLATRYSLLATRYVERAR